MWPNYYVIIKAWYILLLKLSDLEISIVLYILEGFTYLLIPLSEWIFCKQLSRSTKQELATWRQYTIFIFINSLIFREIYFITRILCSVHE